MPCALAREALHLPLKATWPGKSHGLPLASDGGGQDALDGSVRRVTGGDRPARAALQPGRGSRRRAGKPAGP